MFVVKSGHHLPYKELEDLTNAIVVASSSAESTEDRQSFQELHMSYGLDGIHRYIRNYLSEMSVENFQKFQEIIDNDY